MEGGKGGKASEASEASLARQENDDLRSPPALGSLDWFGMLIKVEV